MLPDFDVRGECNGVKYGLRIGDVLGDTAILALYVHEDILKRTGEELETRRISSLGFEWTACLTANEDNSINMALRLCSPVSETETRRCMWIIFLPSFIPGSPSPLKQNGRYGDTCPESEVDPAGYIGISLSMRLDASSEKLVVHESETETCCVWRLMPGPSRSWRTNRFTSHGKEWGLCLYEYGNGDTLFKIMKLSITDPVPVESTAIIIDQSSPELSEKINIQAQEEEENVLSACIKGQRSESVLRSFLHNGWLKIGLRFSFPDTQPQLPEDFYPLEKPRIVVEVLTDQQIRDYVIKEASANIFDAKRRQVYLSPPHWSLTTVKQMILRDAQSDPSASMLWLWHTERDNGCSKATNLDALEELDFRLCELSEQRNPNDDNHSIAFYFRTIENEELSKDQENSILLFCLFLDPQENKLEYIGSILADWNAHLYSICFCDVHKLCRNLTNMDFSFFVVDSRNCTTQIRAFQKTPKEFGLTSGSVIVIRPLGNNEAVNADRIYQELQDLRQDRSLNPTSDRSSL